MAHTLVALKSDPVQPPTPNAKYDNKAAAALQLHSIQFGLRPRVNEGRTNGGEFTSSPSFLPLVNPFVFGFLLPSSLGVESVGVGQVSDNGTA